MHSRRWFVLFALAVAWSLVACAPQIVTQTVAQTQVVNQTQIVQSVVTEAPGSVGAGLLPPAGQMIIKNADIELMVSDSKQALVRITQLSADDGGYILSSETSYVDGQAHGSLQMVVPSAQFETTLNQLRNIGLKVLKESSSGQDVSAEYTDLQSRLDNLEATAARVRTFLDESKTVEDSLRVNSQLSDLEGQIEQIKGQMKYDQTRAAFSTISVTLTPQPLEVTPTPEPGWNPVQTFNHASVALGALLHVSADAAIWLLVLASPLILALLVLIVLRRLLRPRRA